MSKPHNCSGAEDCFGCKVKTIQLSPNATPSRRNHIPPKVNKESNAWHRGVVQDSRGMPLLNEKLAPVGLKEYSENRHKYDEGRRKTMHAQLNKE